MGNQKNSIFLNGKLYDTVTGEIIHQAPVHHAAVQAASKPKVKKKSGLTIDGFTRRPVASHATTPHPHHHSPATQKPKEPIHATARHIPRHKPQKGVTLMRQAVTKPVAQPRSDAKHLTARDERTSQRLARARATPKSTLIQRFPHGSAMRPVPKKHQALAVQAAPTHKNLQPATAAPAAAPTVLSASETLVTNALRNAHAHEANHPYAKKPKHRLSHHFGVRHRTLHLASGALAVLLLTGFVAYSNAPNLSMRVASNRAGFNASLPGYKPAGFSLANPVTYGPGKITVSFHSNSDDRSFKLIQQVSNWNSQALADNFMAVNNKPYQTYEQQGRTIYIYGDSSATWVNGGVWYQIEGKSSLNSDQLLKIANSI